jgi:hypothetical protein
MSTSMGSLPMINLTNDTEENLKERDASPEPVVTMIMDQKGLDSARDEEARKRTVNTFVVSNHKLPIMM